MGFQVIVCTLLAIAAACGLPFVTILNLDAISFAIIKVFKININLETLPFRFFVCFWTGLEVVRSVIITLLPVMTTFSVPQKIVRRIANIGNISKGIELYKQIQVLNAAGLKAIQEAAGIGMSVGVVIVAFSGAIMISGYDSTPLVVLLVCISFKYSSHCNYFTYTAAYSWMLYVKRALGQCGMAKGFDTLPGFTWAPL